MTKNLTKYLFSTLLLALLSFSSFAEEKKCTAAIDSSSFNQIAKKLNDHDFEDAKKAELIETLTKNCFSSIQVNALIELLEFEEDKIAVAKAGHTRVIDPENYDLVFDVFEFESSKKEVMDYIASNK